MKRHIALVLSLVLVFALAACGKTSTSASTAPSATQATSSEVVPITYSFWGTPDEAATVQTVADKFNASQGKIKVTVMPVPHDQYVEKLNTMATANQLPDCGIMSEAAVLQFAQSGLLADISKMYGANDAKPLDSLTYKYKGAPVAYAAANEVLIMYYNKTMFDKAKVPYPPADAASAWTWDQFVATAKLLTLDSNGNNANSPKFDSKKIVQYGCMVENLTWQLETWALSNGAGFYSSDGSKVIINDPATEEAIQKVADLYLKDHVAPLSTGLTDDGIQRSIIAGTCAMATGGTWNVGTCLAKARDAGLSYGVAVLPYMKDKVTINTAGPNVVFSQSKHQAEAMEFIKWYMQEDNSWDLIKSGIWMPLLKTYYTDESLTHKWVDNPNFPDYAQYKTAVVDYALNNAKPTSWFYVNNTTDFNTLLGSLLGPVWTGEKTAKQAIDAGYDSLVAANKGNG